LGKKKKIPAKLGNKDHPKKKKAAIEGQSKLGPRLRKGGSGSLELRIREKSPPTL